MYPYTETETPLSILSPCVSVREYRGSARRARGLKDGGVEKQRQQQTGYHTPPLPCPAALRGATKQHREKDYFSILSPCVPTRNIGGVPVGRGG